MDRYYVKLHGVKVEVTKDVYRAYADNGRLYRVQRRLGQCELSRWYACPGDCHLCSWWVPQDDAYDAELCDAVRHARGEYGANAEDVVMLRLAIEQVLAALNDTQREVIMLAADGLTNAEIARAMGISRKRVYRARLRAQEIGRRIASSSD